LLLIMFLANNQQDTPPNLFFTYTRFEHNSQKDCDKCDDSTGYMETIKRTVTIKGKLSSSQKERLEQIADRCPVHKTLSQKIDIKTKIEY
ncbi:hypothetical protein Lfee_0002, partial [Legionella feeleii]